MGFDLGETGSGVLSWTISCQEFTKRPRHLARDYIGASGKVALEPGLGANVPIGGSRRSVALQPVSIEPAIGIDLAATVTHLTLGEREAR
jgi:hypothetical protein